MNPNIRASSAGCMVQWSTRNSGRWRRKKLPTKGFTALMLVVGFRVFTLHRVSLGFCLRLKRGPSILVRVGPGTLKTMNPSCLEIGTAYLSTMPPPLCPSRILGGDH